MNTYNWHTSSYDDCSRVDQPEINISCKYRADRKYVFREYICNNILSIFKYVFFGIFNLIFFFEENLISFKIFYNYNNLLIYKIYYIEFLLLNFLNSKNIYIDKVEILR